MNRIIMVITDYKQEIKRLQDKLRKAKKEKFLAEQRAKKADWDFTNQQEESWKNIHEMGEL